MNGRSNATVPPTGSVERNPAEAVLVAALWRAAMYRLLASALRYPCAESVTTVRELAQRLAAGLPEYAPWLGRIRQVALTKETVEDLGAEYVRLFERESPCPPREGSWIQGPISGRPALLADLGGFYAAFGVRLGTAMADSEDHVAAELEFASWLELRYAYAIATLAHEGASVVHEALRTFWRDHLGRFVIPFACFLEGATHYSFYAVAANLLAAWAHAECGRLQVKPELDGTPTHGLAVEEASFTCPLAGYR